MYKIIILRAYKSHLLKYVDKNWQRLDLMNLHENLLIQIPFADLVFPIKISP